MGEKRVYFAEFKSQAVEMAMQPEATKVRSCVSGYGEAMCNKTRQYRQDEYMRPVEIELQGNIKIAA